MKHYQIKKTNAQGKLIPVEVLKDSLRTILSVTLIILGIEKEADAQMATIDASNLAQAILSFIQDGDDMTMETQQFLSGMDVLKEQADLLREGEERYRRVGAALYKSSDLVSMARRYESMARQMTSYANCLKKAISSGDDIHASRVEYLIKRGSSLLSAAMREVERTKEYLSPSSSLSEAERRQGIRESKETLDHLGKKLDYEVRLTLKEMDAARIMDENLSVLREAGRITRRK